MIIALPNGCTSCWDMLETGTLQNQISRIKYVESWNLHHTTISIGLCKKKKKKKSKPKVTTITESQDLTNMSLATLFGKLQEHEMELLRLNQHEENDKKKKGISLKASSSIQEESEEEDSIDLDKDEDLSLFVKRFKKIP